MVVPFSKSGDYFLISSTGKAVNCNTLRPFKWDLMQFTGLHDKNGKEIYEGDVLCYKNPKIGNGEVRYNSERGYFELVYASGNRNFIPEPGVMEVMGVEVIGNIYENPTLIP